MGKYFKRICKDCGNKFYTEKPAAQYCPQCLKEHKKAIWKRNNEMSKKPRAASSKPVPVNILLPRMMQLLDLYNKNHGTHYSYGQFVSGIHTGKIKIGVVKNE